MFLNTIISTKNPIGTGTDKNFKLIELWTTPFELFTWFTVKLAFKRDFFVVNCVTNFKISVIDYLELIWHIFI